MAYRASAYFKGNTRKMPPKAQVSGGNAVIFHTHVFNPDALLAVNSVARINFISQAVQNSILTPDEGRALIERGKQPGGDKLLAQVNLVPLDRLGDTSAPADQARSAMRTFLQIEDKPNEDRLPLL